MLQLGRDAARGAAFLTGLGLHLRRPLSMAEAGAVLRERLTRRADDFLDLARHTIYGRPSSPYRQLLDHAGCKYPDLEEAVRHEGIEGALASLFRQGVYLTVGELRGRDPVRRGSLTLHVDLERIRGAEAFVRSSRAAAGHGRLGGWQPLHRAMFADLSVNAMLSLAARAGPSLPGWRFGHWTLRASDGAIVWLMRYHGPGYAPVRWFDSTPSPVHRWPARARGISWLAPRVSRWAGTPLPPPEHVPLTAPQPILDWFETELGAGRTPHLQATVSAAVALCQYAGERGQDLTRVQLGLDSEMVTPDRLAAIRRTGAAALPTYGARESGLLAYGCTRPAESDDMHLYTDSHAVIQAGTAGEAIGLPAEALLVTSLRRSWPLVLLNVSLGDRADLTERACGCPLEQLGWRSHVSAVRSFEKISLGGPFVLLTDLVRLLEGDLPRRFGGGPTDFQIQLADQRDDGQALLRLLVHPRIGSLDEETVHRVVAEAVRATGLPAQLLRSQPGAWLRLERRAPEPAPTGKLLPIQDGRRVAPAPAGPSNRADEPREEP